jgi:hypothetical protein
VKEPFTYRAWKWSLQQLTGHRDGDQLDRLQAIDWDVLVVLDACRADTLQDVAEWPIPTATSPASCTPEWLQCVADSGVFQDAHVVTANPQYFDVDLGASEVEPYWENHWDDSRQTVLPEAVLSRVDELLEDGSHRIVAHLQQPHWPCIGKIGDSWHLAYDDLGPWSVDSSGEVIESVQVAAARGLIDPSRAEIAYRASVDSVWDSLEPYLTRWVKESHSTVVTADHGETFGSVADYLFYEHPCGCHIKPLTKVPFVEFSTADAKEKTDTDVEARLKALGYAE